MGHTPDPFYARMYNRPDAAGTYNIWTPYRPGVTEYLMGLTDTQLEELPKEYKHYNVCRSYDPFS